MRKGENMTNIVIGNNKYDNQDENKKWTQKLKEAKEITIIGTITNFEVVIQ